MLTEKKAKIASKHGDKLKKLEEKINEIKNKLNEKF